MFHSFHRSSKTMTARILSVICMIYVSAPALASGKASAKVNDEYEAYKTEFRKCLDSKKEDCLKKYAKFPLAISWPDLKGCHEDYHEYSEKEFLDCYKKSYLEEEIQSCLQKGRKMSVPTVGMKMVCDIRKMDGRWILLDLGGNETEP